MGFKRLSNVIGAPFRNFVTEQLIKRVEKSSSTQRDMSEVLYLANKEAWVKLASSAEVGADYIKLLQSHYDLNEGFTYGVGNDLAKNWVLSAGTSKQDKTTMTLRSGLGTDGAYGLGGIQDQGYRPMPGLDSVTIETAGRLGSMRYATINFKVWNMNQLDVIDTLYFKLGFTMLLEWGHTVYYDNSKDGALHTDSSGIDGFFETTVLKEGINVAINTKVEESNGNYDGMLGVVTNFNYSMNQEGGWDCSIKLVGLGSLMETQKINSAYNLPPGLARQFKAFNKEVEALKLADAQKQLDKQNSKALTDAETAKKKEKEDYDRTHPIKDVGKIYLAISKNTPDPSGDESNRADYLQKLQTAVVLVPRLFEIGDGGAPSTEFDAGKWTESQAFLWDNKIYIPRLPSNDGFKYPIEKGTIVTLDSTLLWSLSDDNIFFQPKTGKTVKFNLDKLDQAIPLGPLLLGNAKSVPKNGDFIIGGDFLKQFGDRLDKRDIVPNRAYNYTYERNVRIRDKDLKNSNEYSTYSHTYHFILGIKDLGSIPTKSYIMYSSLYDAIAEGLKADANITTGWIVQNVTLLPSDNKVGYTTQNNVAATVTLTKQVTIKAGSVYYYNSKSDINNLQYVKYNTDTVVTLVMETDLLALITDTSKGANQVAPPTELDKNAAAFNAKAQVNTADGLQRATPTGLTSALEAMLTIVQYDAILHPTTKGGVSINPIGKITAQLMGTLPNAPMSKLFNAAGILTQTLDANKKPIISPTPTQPASVYTDPYYLGLKGYNTSLMSGQAAEPGTDAYTTIPTVNFKELLNSYLIPKTFTDSGIDGGLSIINQPVYIKLGYLLFFINNICLLFDSTKSSQTTTGAARPHFYIDFNPETNACFTTPYQLSVDPQVCMVPWKGSAADYESIFKSNNITSGDVKGFFNFVKNDFVSGKIKGFGSDDAQGKYRGYTMNILVNTQHLLDILSSTVDRDNHSDVYFKPFLDRVLADINKALGDVNAFRVGYNDASNTVAIYDDQFVPPVEDEASLMRRDLVDPTGKAIIPIFGKTSITRTLEFQTNITTKMSSLIAIGARGEKNNGSAQSNDASNLHWLNQGVIDRVIKEADDIAKVQSAIAASKVPTTDNTKLLASQFNTHVASIYGSSGTIDKKLVQPATNYYIQGTTLQKAADSGSAGAPIIPLNLSFSTDGISGISMGNVFRIPEDRMPISLRGRDNYPRFGYMVVGLNHQIEQNQWITNVKGQIIKLRPGDSYQQALKSSTATGTIAATNTLAANNGTSYTPSNGPIPPGCKRTGCTGFDSNAYKSTALYQDPAFKQGIQKLVDKYQLTDPDAIYKIMFNESGIKPSSAIYHAYEIDPVTGKKVLKQLNHPAPGYTLFAGGLVGFTQQTAKSYGTTTDAIIQMSGVDQLKYVEKFYDGVASSINGGGLAQLYAVTFFPIMISHLNDPNWVIQSKNLSSETVSLANKMIPCAAGKSPGAQITVADFLILIGCLGG